MKILFAADHTTVKKKGIPCCKRGDHLIRGGGGGYSFFRDQTFILTISLNVQFFQTLSKANNFFLSIRKQNNFFTSYFI